VLPTPGIQMLFGCFTVLLSRPPKEEKDYNKFMAITRKFGYSKQSILEFKRDIQDY